MKAVYPGSFDPITFGHIDIIERIQPLFAKVIVAISSSNEKSSLFTAQERKKIAEKALAKMKNVEVAINDGLTVDFAKQQGARVVVRGIRAVADFEYEMAMANINRKMVQDIETLIIFSSPQFNYVSSKFIKEIARFKGSLKDFVPTHVAEELKKKYKLLESHK